MLGRRNFRAAGSLDHEKRPKTFAKTAGPAELSVAHGIRRHRAGMNDLPRAFPLSSASHGGRRGLPAAEMATRLEDEVAEWCFDTAGYIVLPGARACLALATLPPPH